MRGVALPSCTDAVRGANGALAGAQFPEATASRSAVANTTDTGEQTWERSSSARTSRSTESSRTRPAWRAAAAAGSPDHGHGPRAVGQGLVRGGAGRAGPADGPAQLRVVRRAGWESREGEWADRLNSLPKYVVASSTLDGPGWSNSTALTGDAVAAVSKLKQQVDGEIVVYAQLPARARADRARPGRRAAADHLPDRARGRRAPLRRDQRRQAHAPGRRPHHR